MLFKINEDEDKDNRTYFSKYYTPIVERKDFNVLIDCKSCFLMFQEKRMKEDLKNLLKLMKIGITQLVIYWTIITFQFIIN